MKVKSINTIININNTLEREDLRTLLNKVKELIESMDHPRGTGKFTLYEKEKSNGVKPIKDSFFEDLKHYGWILEHRLDVGVTPTKPGPIDATYPLSGKHIALEWETGNISSSHRAINKMVSGLLKGTLICGILVMPSREMYRYLTDRVGNFRELEPYFPVWKKANYNIKEGCLIVIEIEHDDLSMDVPKIVKGTDGRAKI
ncbi:PDDEXK family nuclease [Geosporobacter ferrireducens]|uniref:Restriction endonuclease n=1 Tax=Geosporobacter ferrireducens TaxID=1424294 RepID=A0A1D8GPG4_9FIRM|nr:hypothetical protein [Geosporobacter ferrireducens]AOT72792.1 hypothetical protein Gferi_26485 [Geosporobacter ferrireducens]